MRSRREIRIALMGDTMLGRGVGSAIARRGTGRGLVAPGVVEAARAADLVVLNLECCISERGERWPDPGKPFFFRGPPTAIECLDELGVGCVTLANNHALDYGPLALLGTLDHLAGAGIACVGAGADASRARRSAMLSVRALEVAVIGVTDHPAGFAAGAGRPGVAYANLWDEPVPDWLAHEVAAARRRADVVLVTPHWGPNMTTSPLPHVRAAAARLVEAGATVVAGHSAHVFQGAVPPVLFDLGDFIDDYVVDPRLRNDLGLLWTVTVGLAGPTRVKCLPLAIADRRTGEAVGANREWIERRLRAACAEFGSTVHREGGAWWSSDAASGFCGGRIVALPDARTRKGRGGWGIRRCAGLGPAPGEKEDFMKVREAMAKTISTVEVDATVARAAELMRTEDSGFIPVVGGDRLVGVVTDRDVVSGVSPTDAPTRSRRSTT